MEGIPLFEEQVLHEAVELDLLRQITEGLIQSSGLPELQRFLPLIPGLAAVLLLQSHEQGKIRQPAVVFRPEAGEAFPGIPEAAECQTEDLCPVPVQQAVVYFILPDRPGNVFQFFCIQKSILHQSIQVDEVGVAGKGGAGLVGGVAVAGGGQGQDLPMALPRGFQKIHKREGLTTHGADAVGAGQAGNVHQNATASHSASSPLSLYDIALRPVWFRIQKGVGNCKRFQYKDTL